MLYGAGLLRLAALAGEARSYAARRLEYVESASSTPPEWEQHLWDLAAAPRIQAADVETATPLTPADLDGRFFRVRFNRLTKTARDYLRALAALGAGPHRSGKIAERMGAKVSDVGALRTGLIGKSVIYSPKHGNTAFTVPEFANFMRRMTPRWKPPRRTDSL